MKLVLLSLGDDWHPSGSKIVLEALKSKDDRLRACGLETLARSQPSCLLAVLNNDLIDTLIRNGSRRPRSRVASPWRVTSGDQTRDRPRSAQDGLATVQVLVPASNASPKPAKASTASCAQATAPGPRTR